MIGIAMVLLVAGNDGGVVPEGVGQLRVFNTHFDGRALSGLAVICAEEGDIFVDARLDTIATFTVRAIRACESQKEMIFSTADSFKELPGGPVRVRKGQCVGTPFTWRLFRYPLPSQSSCLEVTVGARIRASDGGDSERATTIVRVAP